MAATLLERVAGAVPGLGGGVSHKPKSGPQPFELTCQVCGSPIVGTRTDRGRFEPCGSCGTPAFVLPADVYPRPAAPKKSKNKRTRPAAGVPSPETPPKAPSPPLKERAAVARKAAGEAVRKRATPVRLALLGTLAVVAGTAWWGLRRADERAARQTLVDAPPAAAAALDEGRFEDAAGRYAALAAALRTLGRGDTAPAKLAAQRARETAAAAGLASLSPLEIGRQAAAARTPQARTAWANAFDALYRGRWVVLDTLAAAVPPADAPGLTAGGEETDAEPAGAAGPRVELLYPLSTDGVRVRLVGDPAAPAGLGVSDPPRRVVLAGRYGDCVRVADPAGGAPVWELRLEPGSAFLWATPETLGAVGFDLTGPAGGALRATLAAQAEALGLGGEG